MKYLFSFFFIANLSLLISCSGDKKNESNGITDSVKVEVSKVEETHHHDEQSDSIELDNGAKWKVKPEMLLFLRNMETDIKKFEENKNQKQLTDYKNISKSLQKNIDELTSNCTMEGKAHDELHKWLVPYIGLVDEFNNSKSVEEAEEHFKKIVTAFVTFNNYFE